MDAQHDPPLLTLTTNGSPAIISNFLPIEDIHRIGAIGDGSRPTTIIIPYGGTIYFSPSATCTADEGPVMTVAMKPPPEGVQQIFAEFNLWLIPVRCLTDLCREWMQSP